MKKSVYFPPKTLSQIESFVPSVRRELEFSTKIQEMIDNFHHVLERSKHEVKDMFSEAEWGYLRSMLNGTLLTPDISYRSVLAAEAEDTDRYENLGKMQGVNVNALIEKLKSLTEAQAYAVAKIVDEFWTKQ